MLRRLALGVLVLWLVLPMLPLAIWSVSRGWFFPELLPPALSLEGWRYAVSHGSGVPGAIATTAIVALGAATMAVLAGVPAGRALGLYDFRGKRLIELLLLAPLVVPGLAVAMGLHGLFLAYGLTNTLFGVMLVHLVPALPYVVFVMAGVFANYDIACEDQARTLGASSAQTFLYVTLPAILPGIAVAGLLAFLVSSSQYVTTLLIGGGRVVTLPLLLFSFVSAGRNDIAGAIGVLYLLPGIAAVAITARLLSGGAMRLWR